MPLFGEAISKADYGWLIAKIKAHLDANAIPMWQKCCFICPSMVLFRLFCYLQKMESAITEELRKICAEFDVSKVCAHSGCHIPRDLATSRRTISTDSLR